MKKITEPRVHVIDDDEAVRDAISMLLETVDLPHALYPSANEFLEQFSEDTQGALVVDIRMPGMSGLELQETLNARHVSLPIIFITGHGDVPMAVEAMKRGALDFIRKPFREQDLLDRINEALEAEAQGRATQLALSDLQRQYESLSPREKEVYERVAEGQANKVIAIDLGISERTVEIHRSQVMKKMQARTLAHLVRTKIDLDGAGVT